MTALAPTDRNIIMVPDQRLRDRTPLPLVDLPFVWHEDELRKLLEARLGEKGYRKGQAPGNKGQCYSHEPIPDDTEIVALMDACDVRRMCGKRDRALIAFLRGTGLRINEALDFRLTDLDVEKGKVLVRCGKGGKRAPCGITPDAIREVQAWIDVRADAGYTPEQPLFCVVEGATRGGKMNQACFRGSLRTLKRNAGITKRVHPHCFRHALALSMARAGVPLPVISRQLRHSNVATTATYLRKVSDDEIYETLAGLVWS